MQRIVVFIDTGHGIDTIGKWSPIFRTVARLGDIDILAGERFKEHYFNFPTGQFLKEELSKLNIHSVLIRETEEDIPIHERVRIQNNLFEDYTKRGFKCITISIHANAVGDGSSWIKAFGVETFSHQDCKESTDVAKIVQSKTMSVRRRFTPISSKTDRGNKHANFWHFNRNRRTPGFKGLVVLPEAEFMTYLESLKILATDQYQKDYARAIAEAIAEYQGYTLIGNLNPKESKRV